MRITYSGFVTTNTLEFKSNAPRPNEGKHLLAQSLRIEGSQEFAQQRAKGEFRLGLSTFAFSISKKNKNQDQKFIQCFRESMDHFDRGIRTSQEINDNDGETLIALMKYKVSEFAVEFLSEKIPIPASLMDECISQAISVANAYDVVANPKLPKVHIDIRPFTCKKFGNLLRSENVQRNGINNIILPINSAYYLHVVQIFP